MGECGLVQQFTAKTPAGEKGSLFLKRLDLSSWTDLAECEGRKIFGSRQA